MNGAETNHAARPLTEIVAEIKQELRVFIETRIEMFKNEMREKLRHWKIAAPLAAVGVVLLGTAYLLITLALVALVVSLIGNTPFHWVLAFLGVGVVWALLGGLALYLVKRELEMSRLMPEKTIQVLKDDKLWLQKEAKNQI